MERRFARVFGFLLIAFCLSVSFGSTQTCFRFHYLRPSSFDYDEITIAGRTLTYCSYVFDRPRKTPFSSGPHYREDELSKKSVVLTDKELAQLIDTIKENGILDLPSTLGKEHNSRSYPTWIKITLGTKERKLEFLSSPESGDPPHSFAKLEQTILSLARQKTGLHPEKNRWLPVVPDWEFIQRDMDRMKGKR